MFVRLGLVLCVGFGGVVMVWIEGEEDRRCYFGFVIILRFIRLVILSEFFLCFDFLYCFFT